MRVLVTGFEPFGGSEINPSQQLVDALDADVAKALLPVSYARTADALRAAVREHEPDVVICFGQASGRSTISIERFAHNLDEATTTDNDDAPGSGEAIDPDGPAAYASSLPVDGLVEALRAEGIPAAPSRDAGGFLCNHVFYVLMRTLEQERPTARGGFVHVPLLPEQALATDEPSMPLETLVRAARRYRRDMRAAEIRELNEAPQAVEVDDAAGVEIVAVALNPLDLAVGSGVFYGGHPPLPYAPGCEAVGRLEDGRLAYLFGDGRGVSKPGFLAEQVAFPAEQALPLPDGVDPALAAAAGIAGIAAWVPVAWKAQVTAEDRVLVLGGTGTVGKIAAQAARLLGAETVVAVGRNELARIPEAFGDDGFTVCIDPVWGEPLADALRYAQRHARVVHLGQSAGSQAPLRSADVRGKELLVMGHSNFALTNEERDRAYLELLDHLVAGRIELDYQTFPLEDVAAAWANQRGGKSVVVLTN